MDVLNHGQMLSGRPNQCVTKALLAVDAALVMLKDLSN
jgi:hypothetical protein